MSKTVNCLLCLAAGVVLASGSGAWAKSAHRGGGRKPAVTAAKKAPVKQVVAKRPRNKKVKSVI